MDGKVMLTIFGVLLLLAAIFFFFKSFASHEQRMQEEQRARLELERQKLSEERDAAGRPLTPEELARRKTLAEERKKADEARRVVVEAQRKEAEKKRLEDQIQADKLRGEEEKRRTEEQRLAEEQRARQAAEAAKKAEEDRIKAEEAENARKLQDRKQQAATALAELRSWMESVPQRCATAFPVALQAPITTGVGAAADRVIVIAPGAPAVAVTRTTYRSPDEVPGFTTWSDETLLAFCKQAMNDDAARQESVVTAPGIFQRIGLVDDAGSLKEVHQKLAAQVYQLQDAGEKSGRNQAAGRNLISLALRQVEKLDQQERDAASQPDNSPSANTISNRGPSKQSILAGIRAEKQKTIDRMRTQIVSYWKAMNETRGNAAATKLLMQAKQIVADQLKQLGVDDLGAATSTASTGVTTATGTAVPKPGANYKIYVLNDGTEIKAYTAMKMGDEYALKDETGQVRTVKVGDVKEIKKP